MLTGLALTFIGLTQSKSGLFSALGFIVSHVGKRERGVKEKGWREKGNRKGKEGRSERRKK